MAPANEIDASHYIKLLFFCGYAAVYKTLPAYFDTFLQQ